MTVVSVKFKGRGKTYFFDPNGITVPEGEQVVVETSKGLELAECVQGNHEVTDARIVPPLRPVVRIATADDLRIAELCKAREKEAFGIAEQKIAEHGLDMKLVDVECNFEGSKILFFFTSEGRVDFRELVKDLAGVFRTRIELRQIGVRDEAKMLGGVGICGRPYCCHEFMDDFEPVSTKMAKTQSLSLNPAKISGSCGRLMCCLRYEQEAYEELVKTVPKNGAFVETTEGYGCVAQVNLLRQQVKVRIDGDGDNSLRCFAAEEVATIPGGRPKPGEPLPHVLTVVPKKKEVPEERPERSWMRPPIFAEDTIEQERLQTEKPERSEGEHRRHRGGRGKKPAGERPNGDPQPKQPRPQESRRSEGESQGEKPSGSGHRHHRGGRGGGQPAAEQSKQAQQPKQVQQPRKPAPEAGASDRPQTEKPHSANRYRRYRGRGGGGKKPAEGQKSE